MKVIVLGAGFATRLYPLTQKQAKPLLDIEGRSVISRLLDRIVGHAGIDQITVVVNGKFESDFQEWKRGYASDIPIDIVSNGVMEDGEKLGGVADLGLAYDSLSSVEDHPVFVVAGDNLVDFDFSDSLKAMKEKQRLTVFARRLSKAIPKRYGELTVDDNHRVIGFREKPEVPKSLWASTCLYWFPKGKLARVKEYLRETEDPDALGLFIGWLVEREPVYAQALPGKLFDIGNFESLGQARQWFGADPAG